MPHLTTSIPGTFEDAPETLAAQFESIKLEEPKEKMTTPLEETTLGQLQSDDQTNLLDAIDELRAHGISKHIDLPQLIVCGDQSSGKSSLLEAITHLPFPTKDGICTTFATEVALRRSHKREVRLTITPGPSRTSDADKQRLRRFSATFTNPADFPSLIDAAKKCMNPDSPSSSTPPTAEKSINDDVLHLDISGPNWPPLTIVDLPGLIQSEARGQTAADVRTVRQLVRGYMQNPRSVVLAVVAANYDFANQGVLRLAREADPAGTRTLGIITKPDRVVVGSGDEAAVVSLAKNQEHHLQLGWHVIKNRDYGMGECASEERDRAEREFFAKGIWASVVRPHVGIDALRTRLGSVLLNQIRKELPTLVGEIGKGIAECQGGLEKLGEPREKPADHRRYLVDISKAFERLTGEAVKGTYEDPFFAGEDGLGRRLRAVVQNTNEDFSHVMRTYGHYHTIVDNKAGDSTAKKASESSPSFLESMAPQPLVVERSDYLETVKELIRKSRGRELPGTFNPLRVGELFRMQSTPWEEISKEHADFIWQAALDFLQDVLVRLTDGRTYDALFQDHIQPKMNQIRKELLDKVDELLRPYKSSGCLITYHPKFVESIQQIRRKQMQDGILQNLAMRYGTSTVQASLEEIAKVIAWTDGDAADQFASVELMYCMEAFYKVRNNYFQIT